MKLKVQAQHLQSGDVVGSGEVIHSLVANSINWPSNKVSVVAGGYQKFWGKYTMINVERAEKVKNV